MRQDPEIAPRLDAEARGKKANAELADILQSAGWKVLPEPRNHARGGPDMVVRRGRATYVVEVKAAAEGRSDRLIPLWSQAYLQAGRAAGDKHAPLAVVAAPRIAPRAADQLLSFIADVLPDAAAGVFDFAGLRRFRGPHLEGLDSLPEYHRSSGKSAQEAVHAWPSFWPSDVQPVHHSPADIFSDLNQWMLKVLLAPEIPEHLLAAPREYYRDVSHLAKSASVSAMSASRLVRQLDHEGYLDSHPYLRLVRRRELFSRWQASSHRRVKEIPMRYLLRSEPRAELRKILKRGHAALGLFAAAEELHLGLVHGVPPYVYVPRLTADSLAALKGLVPTLPGEQPDVIVRQAPATQSVFRGLVRADGLPVTDILQVWLDVALHPSRGEEQADFIKRRALAEVIDGQDDG